MSNYDVIGRELAVGDCVSCDGLIWKIEYFSPKMVRLTPLGRKPNEYRAHKSVLKYAWELTLLPAELVTLWLLKGNAK